MSFFNYQAEEFSDVFNEAVGVVDKILHNEENIFKICNPIAAVFAQNRAPGTKKFTKKQLVNAVMETLATQIKILKGADADAVMQMDPSTMTMLINEKYTLLDASATDVERRRCKLLLIAKIFHETFHALTNAFWNLCGFPSEINEDGTLRTVQSTPTGIGRVYGPGKTVIGDNGYAFEEAHFRGRVLDCPVAGYSSPLNILMPAPILNKSKIYVIPDERAFNVLATLEDGNFGKFTDLSLYNVGFQPYKRPGKQSGASSAAAPSPARKKARTERGATAIGHEENYEEEAGEEGLHSDEIAGASSSGMRGMKSSMQHGGMQQQRSHATSSSDEGSEDSEGDLVRRLTVAIYTGGYKN